VILFGRGGKATEIVGDRTIGLPPLNSVLARDMIERTAISRLLDGYRDVPAVAKDKVAEVLVRLSELLIAVPEVCELDINPLLADAAGLVALDARVVVRKVAPGAARLAIRPYPAELEQEAALPGGERFLLRPIRPEDEAELSGLVARCTPEDLRLRFFGPLKAFQHQMAARLSQIDYDREMAIIATAPGSPYGAGRISGVVRLISDPENEAAEFAVLVQSDLKGRGLGYRLMSEILDYAKRRGLKRVFGHVLSENTSMLRMARELGFQLGPSDLGANTVRVDIPVASAWAGSARAARAGADVRRAD
jgi:acetyltransferase